MNLLKAFAILILPAFGLNAFAEPVVLARAAELGCHRIERLRDLGKIDEAYVNKAYAIKIEETPNGPGTFKFTAFQVPGANGASHQIQIDQDENGKAIGAFTEVKGSDGVSPTWPDKDAITLIENGLHYVLDNGTTKAEVMPFYNSMTEGVLGQVQENGQTFARVQFKNKQSSGVLEVTLKLDGSFVSASVK